ncbi:MAG: MFS transporter [Acetanaerobacterium sp.]
MNSAFTKLKVRLANVLGTSVLSKKFMTFAGVHTCFLIFINLHGVFINTLLFRVTGDNTIILWYNIIFFLSCSISMPLGAMFMRKTSPSVSSRTGISLYILMYITFFALMFTGTLKQGMPLIAVLSACAATTYWIAYNVMLIEFSTERNRDVGLSLIGMSGGMVALVMPMISGFVISGFVGMTGYYVMFGISLMIAIATMLLSASKIPPIPSKTHKTYFKLAVHDVLTTPVWRICMSCEFVKGMREGTFMFFLNLLLFDIVQNEAIIGLNVFLTAMLSILANWTIGKFLRPQHRIRWIFTAVTVLFFASALLFFRLDALTIMLMSIVNAYFSIILLNPIAAVLFSLFGRTEHGAQAKYEFLGMKDSFLGLGRCLGVVVVLLFPQTQRGYLIVMCVLTATQYVTVFLAHRAIKQLEGTTELEPAETE